MAGSGNSNSTTNSSGSLLNAPKSANATENYEYATVANIITNPSQVGSFRGRNSRRVSPRPDDTSEGVGVGAIKGLEMG